MWHFFFTWHSKDINLILKIITSLLQLHCIRVQEEVYLFSCIKTEHVSIIIFNILTPTMFCSTPFNTQTKLQDGGVSVFIVCGNTLEDLGILCVNSLL
jgi:hypothetical protein